MIKKRNKDLGFAVPGDSEVSGSQKDNDSSQSVSAGPDGGKITLFWLLQHYSKENAALYKAEKEKRKIEKAGKKEQLRTRGTYIAPAEHILTETQPELDVQVEASRQEKHLQDISNDDFGETVFIDRSSRPGTVMPPKAYLECLGFGKKIALNKMPFIIGRSLKGVDLCVADNKTVGRKHAEISFHSGFYYITDLRSLNHVYLDGEQIPQGREIQLKDRMKISLGDERFIFHMDR